MTRNKRLALIGLGITILVCAAVLMAFLMPRPPDLMARATKVADLANMENASISWNDGRRFVWLDRHHLLAISGAELDLPGRPAVPSKSGVRAMRIDTETGTATPLPCVTAMLRAPMPLSAVPQITNVIISPDQQWLYFSLYPSVSPSTADPNDENRVIRLSDGYTRKQQQHQLDSTVSWLADSKHWIEIEPGTLTIRALNDSHLAHVIPWHSRGWGGGDLELGSDKTTEINAALGKAGRVAAARFEPGGDGNDYGIPSPDGTRVAWMQHSDWLFDWPPEFQRFVQRVGYRSHPSGRIWTTRPDGSDRREIGQFDYEPSPRELLIHGGPADPRPSRAHPAGPEMTGFDWSPDGKHLIFERAGILYSVPAAP